MSTEHFPTDPGATAPSRPPRSVLRMDLTRKVFYSSCSSALFGSTHPTTGWPHAGVSSSASPPQGKARLILGPRGPPPGLHWPPRPTGLPGPYQSQRDGNSQAALHAGWWSAGPRHRRPTRLCRPSGTWMRITPATEANMFFSESFTEENPPQKWRKTRRQQQLREMETTCGLLGPLGFEPEQTLLRRPRENQRDEGGGRGGKTVV